MYVHKCVPRYRFLVRWSVCIIRLDSLPLWVFDSMHQLNVLIQQHSFSERLTESWTVPVKAQENKSLFCLLLLAYIQIAYLLWTVCKQGKAWFSWLSCTSNFHNYIVDSYCTDPTRVSWNVTHHITTVCAIHHWQVTHCNHSLFCLLYKWYNRWKTVSVRRFKLLAKDDMYMSKL